MSTVEALAFRVTLHLPHSKDAADQPSTPGPQVMVMRCRLTEPPTLAAVQAMIVKQFGQHQSRLAPSASALQISLADMRWRYLDEEEQLVDLMCEDDLQEALTLHRLNDIPVFKLHLMDDSTPMTADMSPGKRRPTTADRRASLSAAERTPASVPTAKPFMAHALLQETVEAHQKVAKQVIDRWLRQMPEAYFREIDSTTRMSHLRALIALQMAGQPQEIALFNKELSVYTIIKPQNYIGLLSEVMHSLPKDRRLREANIYTSVGADPLVIDVFEFENPKKLAHKFSRADTQVHAQKYKDLTSAHRCMPEFAFDASCGQEEEEWVAKLESDWDAFVKGCDEHYILRSNSRVVGHHFELLRRAQARECIVATLDAHRNNGGGSSSASAGDESSAGVFEMEQLSDNEDATRLTVVTKTDESAMHDFVFHRIVHYLGRNSVDIDKATLSRVDGYRGDNYVVLTCFLRLSNGTPLDKDSQLARQICADILRLPYLDEQVLSKSRQMPTWTLAETELVLSLGKLVHCLAAELRPLVYTHYHIEQFIVQYPDHVRSLAQLWDIKFAPLSKSSLSSRHPVINELVGQIRLQIDRSIELDDCKIFFQLVLAIIVCTLRTNYFFPQRSSLTLRLDPALLRERDQLLQPFTSNIGTNSSGYNNHSTNNVAAIHAEELPYGLFYVCGRGFVSFHVRFRDIARGGIRVTVPVSQEQHTVAYRTVLSECVEMARTQQLKNKDIPEDGAKVVILVDRSATNVDSALKATVDGLLDLTSPEPDQRNKLIADYLGEDELLFLGPGELITNAMITWICERAKFRHYPFPSAFMASKPGAGINHQEYGVTSDGMAVFLDVALRHCGIDPNHQTFSVKMTGSPADDVCGNLIRTLIKMYRAAVKFVAIADSVGVGEDVRQGLDHRELLRLVDEKLSIVDFARSRLSPDGVISSSHESATAAVTAASGGTAVGMKARNSMPFRVESDVFIPAGGRPLTINDTNWRQFLQADGRTPCSRIIIEGTNLFITQLARLQLSKAGVIIVRYSSATKCSVICSSYEVQASMLLTEPEFLQVKDAYVADVQARYKRSAQLEAEILFKELHLNAPAGSLSQPTNQRRTLPEVATLVGKAILKIKDAIFQSGMLDVYIQPLTTAPSITQSIRPAVRSFFVGSPTSTAVTSPQVEQPVPVTEISGGGDDEYAVALYFQQARALDFVYQPEFHRLCRDMLLDCIPDSVKHIVMSDGECRVDRLLPVGYRKQLLATSLACKIIYAEGINFLDSTLGVDLISDGQAPMTLARRDLNRKIALWSFRYMLESERINEMIAHIRQQATLDTTVRQWVVRVLERGGTRIGIELSQ